MVENTRDIAISWIRGLQARGVRLEVHRGRLWLYPPSAYKELSDAELLVRRHHLAEIRALVAVGFVPPPLPEAEKVEAPAPPVETPAPKCPYCHMPMDTCATMREERPDIWPSIHWHHPEERKRRDAAATAVMMAQVGKQPPYLM
jgi:hypothetical protein